VSESHFVQRLYFPYYLEEIIDFTPIKYDPPINPIHDDIPEMFLWWRDPLEKGRRYGF
jgi:hypothetical protein